MTNSQQAFDKVLKLLLLTLNGVYLCVQSPVLLRRTLENSPISSCDTSDTESCSTLPVNSASLLRRTANQKPSTVRGHVLRKAKVRQSYREQTHARSEHSQHSVNCIATQLPHTHIHCHTSQPSPMTIPNLHLAACNCKYMRFYALYYLHAFALIS